MKLTTFALLPIAAAITLGATQPAGAAEAQRFLTRGRTATTSSESLDATGCRTTSLFVETGEAGGPSNTIAVGPFVVVRLHQQDLCDLDASGNPRALVDVAEFLNLPEGAIVIDKSLESARLAATVLAFDLVSGSELPLTLDLSWTATGLRSHQNEHFVDVTPDQLVVLSAVGSVRSASASGSVTDGQTNYAPEVDLGASLSQLSSGVLLITR